MTIQVSSSAFHEGATIPQQYTADGKDVSPPLHWASGPDGTQAYAVVCEDPDAPRGIWTHWVLFNLPADKHELHEGMAHGHELPGGARQGKNDFGKTGYGGPSPPRGKPHRYFFKVYALDTMLDLHAGATREQLLTAIKGHVLTEGHLMGHYGR